MRTEKFIDKGCKAEGPWDKGRMIKVPHEAVQLNRIFVRKLLKESERGRPK